MTNHDKCYIKTKIETNDQNEKCGLDRVVRELLTFKVKSKE